jgi:hypothetical protein
MVAMVKPKNCKLRYGYGVWRRDKMPEHYTVDWRLEPIVRLYIKARNEQSRSMGTGSVISEPGSPS